MATLARSEDTGRVLTSGGLFGFSVSRYNQQLWANDSQALKERHTAQFRISLTTRARK